MAPILCIKVDVIQPLIDLFSYYIQIDLRKRSRDSYETIIKELSDNYLPCSVLSCLLSHWSDIGLLVWYWLVFPYTYLARIS
jgi:hypothetical protein